jgi:hypothetical protein
MRIAIRILSESSAHKNTPRVFDAEEVRERAIVVAIENHYVGNLTEFE